ncbi:hypothetical protein WJ58_26150 [Burkholderia ubonensis]|nr:hypothetical protein WJ58_26150 [Burkholderia ubonensis]
MVTGFTILVSLEEVWLKFCVERVDTNTSLACVFRCFYLPVLSMRMLNNVGAINILGILFCQNMGE